MKLTGSNSVKSWSVAVACSFVNFVLLIPILTSGMWFVEFLDRYDTNRRNASLFVIISVVLKCFTGPFVGYLGEIFEIRSLSVVGSFCASLGVGICFLAEDIITVTVCLGFIHGIGASLTNSIMPQILKQHFTKNIVNANGVVFAGTTIGTFAIIPVISILLDTYGVSGALLLTSGIMLHGVPMAMLLKDPKVRKKGQLPLRESIKNYNDIKNLSDSMKIIEEQQNGTINAKTTESIERSKGVPENDKKSLSVSNTKGYQVNYTTHNANNCDREFMSNNRFLPKNTQPIINLKHGNLSNTTSRINSNGEHSRMFGEQNKYFKALKTFTILRNPPFLVIMICLSAQTYIYIFLCTTIIDISRDKGILRSQEQLFLMFFNVAQTVGFTCFGWVVDKGFITSANFVAVDFLCMGLSCCALVFTNSFAAMMTAVLAIGLFASAGISASPGLVYEFVEEEKQTMAIASRMFLYAPMSFTMAPMIDNSVFKNYRRRSLRGRKSEHPPERRSIMGFCQSTVAA